MNYLSNLSPEQLRRIEQVFMERESKEREEERLAREIRGKSKASSGSSPKPDASTQGTQTIITTVTSLTNPQDYVLIGGATGLYGSQPVISKFELPGMNKLTWENTHAKLHESGLYMPTSAIFMQHFENVVEAYQNGRNLIQADGNSVSKPELEEIYKHLTTNFKDVYGHGQAGAWTWLNDLFEKDGNDWFVKQVVGIEKGKVKFAPRKSLESCLNKDTFANFKKRNSQGLLTEEKGSTYSQGDNVYFWKPRDGAVAWFYASSNGACLYCNRDPSDSSTSLGVFACAEGTATQKI